jgi:hypothetical protein
MESKVINMIALAVSFLGIIFGIGAMAFTFYPKYMMITQVLILLMAACSGLSILFLFMMKGVEGYLDAKLKGGIIFFVSKINGEIEMKIPSKAQLQCEPYAKTIREADNPKGADGYVNEAHTRNSFGGVPAFQIFETTPFEKKKTPNDLFNQLERVGTNQVLQFKEQCMITNANEFETISLQSVTRYFNYVNPHYVGVRIERMAAELSKEYRQTWKTILPWISIMLVGLIFAAIAYVIITSVAGPSATQLANSQVPVVTPIGK